MTRPAPILLASASPRRAALLADAGIPFEVARVDPVDETPPPGVGPQETVRRLALRKARAAAGDHRARLVLAADTLVFLAGRVLGKPADAAEAARMLSALSGRAHTVATGVALLGTDAAGGPREESGSRASTVRFRRLEADEIERYVATGEPLDKAGAYALQGGAADFVEALEGERDTVIGLPLALVRELMALFGRDGGGPAAPSECR